MFIEIPASKRSISQRKLVYGVGINDADYIISPTVNGKQVMCKFYQVWISMLSRCYYSVPNFKRPTYKDCSACDEWLTFSNFRRWMASQDWEGMHLDKDIKIKGNKVYSPEACIFVTQSQNNVEAIAKNYKFKSPEGSVVTIYNLSEFCRGMSLEQSLMSRVSLGKNKSHKGWTKA